MSYVVLLRIGDRCMLMFHILSLEESSFLALENLRIFLQHLDTIVCSLLLDCLGLREVFIEFFEKMSIGGKHF